MAQRALPAALASPEELSVFTPWLGSGSELPPDPKHSWVRFFRERSFLEQRLLPEVSVAAKPWQFGAGSGAEPILDVGMSCLFHG